MATISKPPQILNLLRCPLSPNHFPVSLSLPLRATTSFQSRLGALKTGSDGGGGGGGGSTIGPDLLRKPVVSPRKDLAEVSSEEEDQIEPNRNYVVLDDIDDDDEEEEEDKDNWVDWEDKILEDTVPLVGFVRMILHSGKYESGDRLTPEHERTILERLLPYHPEFEKKIGCGIDYITVGYHPDFQRSRCMFIVQKDGKLVDFSYWKCIKGMIRKNYPLYADSFILRHFRQRRNRNF